MAEPAENLPDIIDADIAKIDVGKALTLRIKNKLTYQQIANQFGVSKQAVQQRLSKLFELINDPDADQAYSDNRADVLNAIEREMVSQMLDSEKLKKASVNNIAYAFQQITNARRLEQGLSTQNIAQNVKVRDMADDDRQALERALKSMYQQGSCQNVKVEENKVQEAEIVGEIDSISPIKEAANPSTNEINKLE